MSRVAIPNGRATVSTQMGALEIVIPSKRNLFVTAFLMAWLGGWFFGEASAIQSLHSGRPDGGATGFLLFWLIGWTIGGIAVGTTVLWNLAGKEILVVGRGELVHRRVIGGLGRSKSYDLAHVRELRVSPYIAASLVQRNQSPFGFASGPIAFDYGAKTVRMGAGVEEAEAKQLVEMIKNRFNI